MSRQLWFLDELCPPVKVAAAVRFPGFEFERGSYGLEGPTCLGFKNPTSDIRQYQCKLYMNLCGERPIELKHQVHTVRISVGSLLVHGDFAPSSMSLPLYLDVQCSSKTRPVRHEALTFYLALLNDRVRKYRVAQRLLCCSGTLPIH